MTVRHKLLSIASVLCLLIVSSCGRRGNSDSIYIDLPSKGLAYTDTLMFPLEIADSVTEGFLTVAVDHTPDYRYANLWIEISHLEGNEGNAYRRRDSIKIELCDSIGNWIGTGTAANYQVESSPVEVILNSASPVLVRHIMAIDTIRGLNRIGVFFNPLTPTDSI